MREAPAQRCRRTAVRAHLTCGHEKRNAKFPTEHPRPQVLQRAPVEGQSAAHQHVQHHAETLRPKQRSQQQRQRERSGDCS